MLGRDPRPGDRLDHRGLLRGAGRDGLRARRARRRSSARSRASRRSRSTTSGRRSLITRNTNDVQQVQTVVFLGLTVMISAPILAVGGVIMALRQDVPLSALLVVILPIMGLVIGLVMSRAIPLFRAMQVKLDRINQVMREALAGVRVIRAFVRDPPRGGALRRRPTRTCSSTVDPGQPAVRRDDPDDDRRSSTCRRSR